MMPRGSNQVGNIVKGTIMAILVLLIGVSMGDTVVTQITAINTTAWTFTGHEAVAVVIGLIPLMYYAGVVVGAGLAFLKIIR